MPDLLSRKELIALWEEIAAKFNAELHLPVNNDSSLVMKFKFNHEFGETQVMIKDLAGTGLNNASGMESSITSLLASPLKNKLQVTLPPLFSKLGLALSKNVTVINLDGTDYWVRSNSAGLRKQIKAGKLERLSHIQPVFLKAHSKEVLLSTRRFLGKKDQILGLMSLHKKLLILLSEETI